VGGKTGTAQKYENGVISQGKYVMSFIGFMPADNPEYLCLTIVDEPKNGNYGSTVAAPICKKVFENILNLKELRNETI
ncbi:MAG: penicillin-binding protein 2, partial [Clostridia bacterium]|nr:penicillin-binding protein 2 [Clostridia bacterium]